MNKSKRIAIFPAVYKSIGQIGFNAGWLTDSNYCFVWANFTTREEANKLLAENYPEVELVNYDKNTDCFHRDNRPENTNQVKEYMTIIVNTKPKKWNKRTISYEELLTLQNLPDDIYSVVIHRGNMVEGLSRGKKINVVDGDVFNIMKT